jgi:hypothetical protein
MGGVRNLSQAVTVDSRAYGSAAAAATINGITLPVKMNVSQPTGPLFAGTYSDVITWTINAN